MAGRDHRPIDYDSLSSTYDGHRTADPRVVQHILGRLQTYPMCVLDIGCGTGGHTVLIQRKTKAFAVGIDISRGMLSKALPKSDRAEFIQCRAELLPFTASSFDFVLMIEVIHQLADPAAAINEAFRVLSHNGHLCIWTQSHMQIADRTTSYYFPSTIEIDKVRYPSIKSIEQMMQHAGFHDIDIEVITFEVSIDHDFLETVAQKGFSMLHLIDQSEFTCGLQSLQRDLARMGPSVAKLGYTLILGKK